MTMITDDARHHYLNGFCSALAVAIHEETGWQIVVNTDDEGASGHAMVRRPDGLLIDITCQPISADELLAAWPGSELLDVTPGDLAEWGWPTSTWTGQFDDAEMAAAVLERVG